MITANRRAAGYRMACWAVGCFAHARMAGCQQPSTLRQAVCARLLGLKASPLHRPHCPLPLLPQARSATCPCAACSTASATSPTRVRRLLRLRLLLQHWGRMACCVCCFGLLLSKSEPSLLGLAPFTHPSPTPANRAPSLSPTTTFMQTSWPARLRWTRRGTWWCSTAGAPAWRACLRRETCTTWSGARWVLRQGLVCCRGPGNAGGRRREGGVAPGGWFTRKGWLLQCGLWPGNAANATYCWGVCLHGVVWLGIRATEDCMGKPQ